jgi:hypothetical protein
MRMRLKAKGTAQAPAPRSTCSPASNGIRPRIGDRAVEGLSTATPEQLELFDTLNLPKPA